MNRILKALSLKLKANLSFTLVEVLVSMGILVMISSAVILYSKSGERQITLYIEKQKIAGTIFRAKSFTLQNYNVGETNCGYGLEIDYQRGEYRIFYYTPSPSPQRNCDSITNLSPGRITGFSSYTKIATGLAFPPLGSLPPDALRYVLFIPPDPKIVVNIGQGGAPTSAPAKIYLRTADGRAEATITVNLAGQVDF